jgi:hypothetical protein
MQPAWVEGLSLAMHFRVLDLFSIYLCYYSEVMPGEFRLGLSANPIVDD